MKTQKVLLDHDPESPYDLYEIIEISEDDIEPPDALFMQTVRKIPSLSFINTFTVKEFMRLVKKKIFNS